MRSFYDKLMEKIDASMLDDALTIFSILCCGSPASVRNGDRNDLGNLPLEEAHHSKHGF